MKKSKSVEKYIKNIKKLKRYKLRSKKVLYIKYKKENIKDLKLKKNFKFKITTRLCFHEYRLDCIFNKLSLNTYTDNKFISACT